MQPGGSAPVTNVGCGFAEPLENFATQFEFGRTAVSSAVKGTVPGSLREATLSPAKLLSGKKCSVLVQPASIESA